MTTRSLILIICASAMTVWADSYAAVHGPVTGYIFDAQSRAIRPMMGLPGGAYLGATVLSNVDFASVSPDGSAAFAIQAGGLVLYTGLTGTSPAAVNLHGSIAADRFAWAPGAAAAAIYSSKTAQAQIVSNLLEKPSAGAPIDLSALSGQVAAMAFDGQQIIMAVAAGATGGVYTVAAQSSPQRIASTVSPSALTLAGTDLYFADQQTQQIWQVQKYATQPAQVLFANDAGISKPVGLQLSADDKRLYLADAGSRALAVYDVAARSQIENIPLNFTPSHLDRFGSASVFLLNGMDQAHSPLYVLTDANPAKPTVYFVPASGANSSHPIRYRPD